MNNFLTRIHFVLSDKYIVVNIVNHMLYAGVILFQDQVKDLMTVRKTETKSIIEPLKYH